MNIRNKNARTIAGGATILLILSFVGLPSMAESFVAIFAILVLGWEIGPLLLPSRHRATQFIFGIFNATALIMLVRGIWFYAGLNLNGYGHLIPIATSLLIASVWCACIEPHPRAHKREDEERLPTRKRVLAIASVGLSFAVMLLILSAAHKVGTADAIRTPWPLMPIWTLPLIALQWMLLVASAWRIRSSTMTTLQGAFAIASVTCLTPLLYTIGYGFDGFLHVAGERVLATTGTLLPHPPYYMGQYVFTTWIARIADLDVALIDRWLVPLCAPLFLALAMLAATSAKSRMPLIAGAFLIPLTALIATTPHGFATVLGISALILAIGVSEQRIHPTAPLLIAAWCVLTHPLIGLPIAGAVLASVIYHRESRWRTMLAIICAIGAGVSVPLVFGFAASLGSSTGVALNAGAIFSWNGWQPLLSSWIPWVGNRYALWPEASVWIEKLLPWLFVAIATSATIRSFTATHPRSLSAPSDPRPAPLLPWLIASFVTALSAGILSVGGDFGFLIDYERGNYADRLWLVAILLLIPVVLPELARLLDRARNAPRLSAIITLIAIGTIGAGTGYAALPRHDAVTPSRGWSVGSADIEAVKLIEEDANGEDYTVLANQSVSAAAVKTLGFKRYARNDVFFYPIPTGGDLYQLFLTASYNDPSRETMREAGDLGGSDLVYFVVNDYWWKSAELIEKAGASADRIFPIREGKVTVFKYELRR